MLYNDYTAGFRPKRNCHSAIKVLNKVIENGRINYVVDADIKAFFNKFQQTPYEYDIIKIYTKHIVHNVYMI